ncbi:hypothetical protein KW782_01055 [Candidatus Parcubacteria bacterium]|nr:hypothetical protein [Candidatus Parcubacteria bacterium]
MSFNKIHFILGFLLIILPFIGIPSIGETSFLIVIGAVLVILAILERIMPRHRISEPRDEARGYVENK